MTTPNAPRSRQVPGLAERYRLWREYRTTVAQLSGLGHRQLADLGISPSTIRSTAREAVYGGQ